MKKNFLTLSLSLITIIGFSQNVGVNATGVVPNASAGLDINFTNKGLLVPRIALTGINDAATIAIPATSLLVYNTNAGLPDGVGYYYNSNTPVAPVWIRLTTGAASNDWTLLGNAGTNPATNFIGTTDAQDWVVRTSNLERMRITSGGNFGFGLSIPARKFHFHDAVGADAYIALTTSTSGFAPGDGMEFSSNSDLGANLWNWENGYIRLGTNNTERMRVLSGGSVGVGLTTSSSAEVPVLFTNSRSSIEGTNPRLILYETDQAVDNKEWDIWATNGELAIVASQDIAGGSGGNSFRFLRANQQVQSFRGFISGNPWFTIDNSSQRVGIGTTTPQTKLEVSANSSQGVMSTRLLSGVGNNIGGYAFSGLNSSSSVVIYGTIQAIIKGNSPGSENGRLDFYTRTGGGLTRKMVINEFGDVGIGNFNPSVAPGAKLEILGDIKIVDGTQGAGKVLTSDVAGLASWQVPAGGGGSGWDLTGNSIAATDFIGTTNSRDFVIKTKNIERMRITQFNGSVGIGTASPSSFVNIVNASTNTNDALSVINNSTFGGTRTANFSNMYASEFAQTGVVYVNRQNNGRLIKFTVNNTLQGDITVSGATISYNAFTGSHYGFINNKATEKELSTGLLMSMTGNNTYLNNDPESEIIYGIKITNKANDPSTLGAYLSYSQTDSATNTDIQLIMAVGNGVMWVVDNGEDIQIGDYLISSTVEGHAMKDLQQYETSYVVAKAAELINWKEVSKNINGVKHKKISVLFEVFKQENLAIKINNQQKKIEKQQIELNIIKVEINQNNIRLKTLEEFLKTAKK